MRVVVEQPLAIDYKGLRVESAYRIDLLVDDQVLIEIKSVTAFAEVHRMQVLTYMKLSGIRTAFLMNFTQPRLMDGLLSFVL